jgi:hypothetical protein
MPERHRLDWQQIGHLIHTPAIATDVGFLCADGTEVFVTELELVEHHPEHGDPDTPIFVTRPGELSVRFAVTNLMSAGVFELLTGIPQAPIYERLALERGLTL